VDRSLRSAASVLGLLALSASAGAAAESSKQLVRVSGTVQYQVRGNAAFKPLFGSLDLPDDALAVTLADSQGMVKLADSSEIDIGSRVRIRLAAFNAAATGKPNVVTLELGAVHFVVRHPQGGKANYVFITPTSQIAVRGTEGYIVTGPKGTDFYCAACSEGDVTMRVGNRTIPLVTGQQVFVLGSDQATAETNVVTAPCTNPAAIAISNGKLGKGIAPSEQVDTTGAITADPLRPPVKPRAAPVY
jgi:hypothetical protein